MKARFIVLGLALILFAGCATTHAPLFCGLEQGLTREQVERGERCTIKMRRVTYAPPQVGGPGGRRLWSAEGLVRSALIDGHQWEVINYLAQAAPSVADGQREYAVFRDDHLIAWGHGNAPWRVIWHPDRVAQTPSSGSGSEPLLQTTR